MKIYDCCIFFDEKMLLDIRLNILYKYVEKFIIVEAAFTHSGKPKKFNFRIKDYLKFKDKIVYIKVKNLPNNLHKISNSMDQLTRDNLNILNSLKIENFHRNKIMDGLKKTEDEDLIIISDVDEIPKLESLNSHHLKKDIILFKQNIFYYKFNLKHPTLEWFGSKAIKKKKLKSPQELRNVKNKIYPFWRIDTFFIKNKKTNISIVNDGGWHFTNIKKPKDIYHKFLNFLHHTDFRQSKLTKMDIENHVKNKIITYGHNIDKKKDRWSEKVNLKKVSIKFLPKFLIENKKKFNKWILK